MPTTRIGPAEVGKHVWVVTNFLHPRVPSVRRYRFRRWADNDNGAVVDSRGAILWVPAASYRVFCTTLDAAAEVFRSLVRSQRDELTVAAGRLDSLLAAETIPVETMPPG